MDHLILLILSVTLAMLGSHLDNVSTKRALARGGRETNVWVVQKLMDTFGDDWAAAKNLLVFIWATFFGIIVGPGVGFIMAGGFTLIAVWNETRMR